MSKEIKVGLLIAASLIMFCVLYAFLDEIKVRTNTYEICTYFDTVEKIDKGAQVRLSGFKVGSVTGIELTENLKAKITMKIDRKIKIPADSDCLATSGAIIGEIFIKINPGTSTRHLADGDTIKASAKVNFDEVTDNVNDLLKVTEESMTKVNEILSHKGAIINSLENINQITKRVDELTEQVNEIVKVSRVDITGTISNINNASMHAASIADSIDKFVASDAIPDAGTALAEAKDAMKILKDTVANVQVIVATVGDQAGSLKNIMDRADSILAKIDYTTIQAQQLISNLNEASESVKDVATDENLKKNISETAENIRETTQQAKELVTALNQKFGGLTKGEKLEAKPQADAYYNPDKETFTLDAYVDIMKGKQGGRIGMYDIGEGNKFTLMYNRRLSEASMLRGGLFRSRLGIGYDYTSGPFGLSADLYRPNDPYLFLRGKYRLNNNLSLMVGAEDLLHKENRKPVFGVSLAY
ncbi:MAG: MCE family protein [Abditibacteriota bacterium]|nr:MCE family protein [Abditibacteriota bacterium]